MEINALGKILHDMYSNAKRDKVAMIYLFGIKYSDDIKRFDVAEIVKISGINVLSYATEIRKAIKLANYVVLNENGIKNTLITL
jgi:hypothetical protein